MYDGAPRSAELYLLLEKEINLLNGIERKRTIVRQYIREQNVEKDLDELGMPIRWIGYRGKQILASKGYQNNVMIPFLIAFADIVCEMDSLRTQHIRRLTTLYRRLKTPMVKGERIKFLTHLQDYLNAESDMPIVKEVSTNNAYVVTI